MRTPEYLSDLHRSVSIVFAIFSKKGCGDHNYYGMALIFSQLSLLLEGVAPTVKNTVQALKHPSADAAT